MARGFFRKIFSFGERDEPEDERVVEPDAAPAAETEAGRDQEPTGPVADDAPPPEVAQPADATRQDLDPEAATEAALSLPGASLPEPVVEEPPLDEPPPADPPIEEPEQHPAPAPTPRPRGTGGRVSVGERVERLGEQDTAKPSRSSWLARLSSGLSRSSRDLSNNLSVAFASRQLTEEALEEMEDALIAADLGVPVALSVTETLRDTRFGRDLTLDDVRGVVASEVEKALAPVAGPLDLDLAHAPHVILVVGVNGTGKTTTIGKLSAKLVDGGLKVTLAAGDTFRAAAIEQLKIWGERTGSEVVASQIGADAAGIAYSGFEKARDNGSDVLIIDTAGRLQNRTELMDELAKIIRVLKKHDPDAPHTVLQTLDATTGQNAMNQVEIFQRVAGVDGLVMTKLDGTARGGILVAIAEKFKLPVWFIGVGEKVEDLEPFRARDFARAIAGLANR